MTAKQKNERRIQTRISACHVITSYGYSAKNLGGMFRLQQIIQAVFGNFTDRTKDDVSFSNYLAKYDVIRATNECNEVRYIAVEMDCQTTEVTVLLTKVQRLLSFVKRKPSLNRKYGPMLKQFRREIEMTDHDTEHMFLKYDTMKKQIMAGSTSREML